MIPLKPLLILLMSLMPVMLMETINFLCANSSNVFKTKKTCGEMLTVQVMVISAVIVHLNLTVLDLGLVPISTKLLKIS